MKQAIIYTRFSPRPNANDSMSCEFQEQKSREYCEYKGLDVLAVYQDRNISGKRADNRPGLQQALVHVCKEQGVLVVYSLARLARSTKDAIIIAETLEKKQADLALVTQQIDTSTPMGRAFFKIMAVFGELERETTAERTKVVLANMQNKGYRITRRPPYGYKLDPKKPTRYVKAENGKWKKIAGRIIPNPDETVIIGVVLNCYNRGMGWTQIKRYLEANGHLPREGNKSWPLSTVKKIVLRYAKQGRHRSV